jgi:steroid 5-alpha reductase family enzyme
MTQLLLDGVRNGSRIESFLVGKGFRGTPASDRRYEMLARAFGKCGYATTPSVEFWLVFLIATLMAIITMYAIAPPLPSPDQAVKTRGDLLE